MTTYFLQFSIGDKMKVSNILAVILAKKLFLSFLQFYSTGTVRTLEKRRKEA